MKPAKHVKVNLNCKEKESGRKSSKQESSSDEKRE
jgi:hypothetical protein